MKRLPPPPLPAGLAPNSPAPRNLLAPNELAPRSSMAPQPEAQPEAIAPLPPSRFSPTRVQSKTPTVYSPRPNPSAPASTAAIREYIYRAPQAPPPTMGGNNSPRSGQYAPKLPKAAKYQSTPSTPALTRPKPYQPANFKPRLYTPVTAEPFKLNPTDTFNSKSTPIVPSSSPNNHVNLYRVEIPGTDETLLAQVKAVEPLAVVWDQQGVIYGGIFSQQNLAQERVQQLQKRGVSSKIIPISRLK